MRVGKQLPPRRRWRIRRLSNAEGLLWRWRRYTNAMNRSRWLGTIRLWHARCLAGPTCPCPRRERGSSARHLWNADFNRPRITACRRRVRRGSWRSWTTVRRVQAGSPWQSSRNGRADGGVTLKPGARPIAKARLLLQGCVADRVHDGPGCNGDSNLQPTSGLGEPGYGGAQTGQSGRVSSG